MRSFCRRKNGAVLAESVLAVSIFVPIMVVLLWAVMEVCYAYVIGIQMTEAARVAARSLADEYLKNRSVISSSSRQNAILANIRIPMMVEDNEQFTIHSWEPKGECRTVTVSCRYIPGVGSNPLPPFPCPDFFGLGGKLEVSSLATAPLY